MKTKLKTTQSLKAVDGKMRSVRLNERENDIHKITSRYDHPQSIRDFYTNDKNNLQYNEIRSPLVTHRGGLNEDQQRIFIRNKLEQGVDINVICDEMSGINRKWYGDVKSERFNSWCKMCREVMEEFQAEQ